VQTIWAAVRANLSLGLVLMGLIAEVLFVVLLAYGILRVVDLLP